jgi:hypothetical protein
MNYEVRRGDKDKVRRKNYEVKLGRITFSEMLTCRLDFGTASYLYRIVPAIGNRAPGSATGQSTQNGVAGFMTTHGSAAILRERLAS